MMIDSGDREQADLERRLFLAKGAALFVGSLWALNPLSSAYAGQMLTFPIGDPDGSPRESYHDIPRIALIIDDIGNNLSRARQFLDIGIPITYSILPRLSRSCLIAEKIFEEGHEIMLHQPMEPFRSDLNPGPGTIYLRHSPEGIAEIIEENLLSVPLVVGVNNHMGSRFTSCEPKVREALEIIKNRELFFVDSLTSHYSIAYKTANQLNIKAGFRNIFLDNIPDESAILVQLKKLKMYALKYRHAIGIGHPHRNTARAIRKFANEPGSENISLVYTSKLLG